MHVDLKLQNVSSPVETMPHTSIDEHTREKVLVCDRAIEAMVALAFYSSREFVGQHQNSAGRIAKAIMKSRVEQIEAALGVFLEALEKTTQPSFVAQCLFPRVRGQKSTACVMTCRSVNMWRRVSHAMIG